MVRTGRERGAGVGHHAGPPHTNTLAVTKIWAMASIDWNYVGKCEPSRRDGLFAPIPFPELVDRLRREMKVLCFHPQPRTDDASYSRAAYCVEVAPDLFDTFFNSPLGYRGAYFESPEKGLQANQLLLGALRPSLIGWTLQREPALDQGWLSESLSLPTAKAWLSEVSLGLCDACAGEWSSSYQSDLQIENGRWERSNHVHAAWGRQVPSLRKIRLFGGFVNSQHQEWVADHKRERAEHIWEHGWS